MFIGTAMFEKLTGMNFMFINCETCVNFLRRVLQRLNI